VISLNFPQDYASCCAIPTGVLFGQVPAIAMGAVMVEVETGMEMGATAAVEIMVAYK
jgi:hypothetical protein